MRKANRKPLTQAAGARPAPVGQAAGTGQNIRVPGPGDATGLFPVNSNSPLSAMGHKRGSAPSAPSNPIHHQPSPNLGKPNRMLPPGHPRLESSQIAKSAGKQKIYWLEFTKIAIFIYSIGIWNKQFECCIIIAAASIPCRNWPSGINQFQMH